MAIMASDNGGGKDFKKVPPGCHFAICNMVVDLGVQESSFQGQAKQQHKVYLRWEVPDERVTYEKDGKDIEGPCSIGSLFTLSLHEKAKLRGVLENWRGRAFTADELKGFDITTVAGKCCQIMVKHDTGADGKTYANVSGVMSTSREQKDRAKAAQSEVGVVIYSLDTPANGWDKLPKWLQEKIEGRVMPPTPRNTSAQAPAGGDFDDDIPF